MEHYIKLCLSEHDLLLAKQFYDLVKEKYTFDHKLRMTYKEVDDMHCFKIYLEEAPAQTLTQEVVDILDYALDDERKFQIETTSDLIQTPSDKRYQQNYIS
jgi:hypothetical protein